MSLSPGFVNLMCELIGGLDDEPSIRAEIEKLGFTHRYTDLTPDDPEKRPWFSYHFISTTPLPNGNTKTYSAQYSSLGLAAILAARKVLTDEHDDKEE